MSVEPLFFGPAERPLFGWLHRPVEPPRLGVVIVKPFGYEAICAHRSIRRLAEVAAAAGLAALRIDLDGTGDSAGDDRDPDRVGAWQRSIGAAIDALRRLAGVDQVVLAGIRLGALLAAGAAVGRTDVAGFLAIAPIVSGRAYSRELKILQGALGLGDPPRGATVEPDVQEALGFALTADTRAALAKLDLVKAPAPAARVLILDRDDLAAADAWAERLRTLGAEVDARRVPGYVEMVLDPHNAVVPEGLLASAANWLGDLSATVPPPGAAATDSPAASALVAPGVRERAVFLDADRVLFAIVSEPAGRPRTGRAVLLLNAGSVYHVGPNRLYVQLARHWAAQGHVVLRVDQAGIGDSLTRPGERDNIVYSRNALDDVAAAVRHARGLPGVRDVRVVGLCSGAYHAFKAAVHGHPIDGVVAINPLTFFWKEGQSLDYPRFKVVSDVERLSHSLLDVAKWKKVLRGEVKVGHAVQTMARFAASKMVDRARDLSRRVGLAWPEDLGAELETVARRRIDLRFVFASGDPGPAMLRAQGGSSVPALLRRGALRVDMIEGPDHTFTPLWSQGALAAVLNAAMGP